ncbi:TetR/AcrR family transcriptional regulator [Bacillus cereus]|nr:TetR/AcrR family transcriptional regulator [Bacillus cereus]
MGSEKQTNLDLAISHYVYRKRTGKKVRDIVKETGVPINQLYSGLRERRLLVKPQRRIDEASLNQAIEMYFEREKLGLTVEEVAKKCNTSVTVLYAGIKDKGYKLKTCGRKFEQEDLEKAIELYGVRKEMGLTVTEISKRTGVPRQTIYWHLDRRGLK